MKHESPKRQMAVKTNRMYFLYGHRSCHRNLEPKALSNCSKGAARNSLTLSCLR